MTKLILVRHGQAENNTSNILSGRAGNYKLTSKGENQIKRIIPLLKKLDIDHIYTSPIRRTKDSAQIISKALSIDYIDDDRLTNMHMGRYTNYIHDKTKENNDLILKFYKEDKEVEEKGMETLKHVQNRIKNMIHYLVKNHKNSNILLVTHIAIIKVLIGDIKKINGNKLYNDISIDKASITTISIDKDVIDNINISIVDEYDIIKEIYNIDCNYKIGDSNC